MTYRKCEYCGAYLDPDETCDCRAEREDENKETCGNAQKEDMNYVIGTEH